MSQEFVGRWKLIHSENFEEYMKEVGVGLITRKAAANLKPTLEIKVEGDLWYSNQYSTFKNTTLSFKLGQVRKCKVFYLQKTKIMLSKKMWVF